MVSLATYWSSFAGSSTLHGPSHTLETGKRSLKLFWAILFLCGLSYAIYQTYYLVKDYVHQNVLTSVSTFTNLNQPEYSTLLYCPDDWLSLRKINNFSIKQDHVNIALEHLTHRAESYQEFFPQSSVYQIPNEFRIAPSSKPAVLKEVSNIMSNVMNCSTMECFLINLSKDLDFENAISEKVVSMGKVCYSVRKPVKDDMVVTFTFLHTENVVDAYPGYTVTFNHYDSVYPAQPVKGSHVVFSAEQESAKPWEKSDEYLLIIGKRKVQEHLDAGKMYFETIIDIERQLKLDGKTCVIGEIQYYFSFKLSVAFDILRFRRILQKYNFEIKGPMIARREINLLIYSLDEFFKIAQLETNVKKWLAVMDDKTYRCIQKRSQMNNQEDDERMDYGSGVDYVDQGSGYGVEDDSQYQESSTVGFGDDQPNRSINDNNETVEPPSTNYHMNNTQTENVDSPTTSTSSSSNDCCSVTVHPYLANKSPFQQMRDEMYVEDFRIKYDVDTVEATNPTKWLDIFKTFYSILLCSEIRMNTPSELVQRGMTGFRFTVKIEKIKRVNSKRQKCRKYENKLNSALLNEICYHPMLKQMRAANLSLKSDTWLKDKLTTSNDTEMLIPSFCPSQLNCEEINFNIVPRQAINRSTIQGNIQEFLSSNKNWTTLVPIPLLGYTSKDLVDYKENIQNFKQNTMGNNLEGLGSYDPPMSLTSAVSLEHLDSATFNSEVQLHDVYGRAHAGAYRADFCNTKKPCWFIRQLTFEFETALIYVERYEYTSLSLIGTVGGIFGLFIGASLMSFVHVIVWGLTSIVKVKASETNAIDIPK